MKKKLPEEVLIGHGSGGSLSRELVRELFVRAFENSHLDTMGDSSIVEMDGNNVTYTTDSYVVDPVIFPGGNIGKLAVCGTVNDLAVAGAVPRYLSAGFIIEEGLKMDILTTIVESMASEARKAGVRIVTGDTKIVNHGKCDKIFINTSGIGDARKNSIDIVNGSRVQPGDKIIINGPVGDHAVAILSARSDIEMETEVISDCASLNRMILDLPVEEGGVTFMRDATRGGLATVLVELAEMTGQSIRIDEDKVPVGSSVSGICEVLGFDPLYLANEGKVVMTVRPEYAEIVLTALRNHPEGERAAIIGEVTGDRSGGVSLTTIIGGTRVIDMLASDQLPRIC